MLLRLFDAKIIALGLLAYCSIDVMAQEDGFIHKPEATYYLDLTESFPSGRLFSKTSSPFDASFMKANEKIAGFNSGVSLYFFKNLSFDFTLSHYELESANNVTLPATLNDPSYSYTRIFSNDEYRITILSFGLSYRFKLYNFSIEPKFLVGPTFFNTPGFDQYFLRSGIHYKTYEYMYTNTNTVSFAPSVSLNYIIRLDKHFGMGIQVSCEYLYMRPNISSVVNIYDSVSMSVINKTQTIRPEIGIWTIHAGMIFRINKATKPKEKKPSASGK